jgi:hypothetical protein
MTVMYINLWRPKLSQFRMQFTARPIYSFYLGRTVQNKSDIVSHMNYIKRDKNFSVTS